MKEENMQKAKGLIIQIEEMEDMVELCKDLAWDGPEKNKLSGPPNFYFVVLWEYLGRERRIRIPQELAPDLKKIQVYYEKELKKLKKRLEEI